MGDIIPFSRLVDHSRQVTPGGSKTGKLWPASRRRRHTGCSSLPEGSLEFDTAYHTAMIASAEHKLVFARLSMACFRHDNNPEDTSFIPLREEFNETLGRLHDAVDRLVSLPATTRDQLRWKKQAIGRIWLRSNESYRESVARDAARLGVK